LSEEQVIPALSVKTFFEDNKKQLQLKLLSKKGDLKKPITDKELHRPGLALAGFVELFTYHRIQICGNTEITYLNKLTSAQRVKALDKVFTFDIPCFVVTGDSHMPDEFIQQADLYKVNVFRTPFATTKLIQLLGDYLDEHFAPNIIVHGSLVDVYGIGLLFTGRSGIGKSEVALDLVARGHRLVADDIVTVARRTGGVLIGKGNKKLGYHMEIRGLGIIDVQAIYGIRGIRRQKRIEVQVELVDWDDSQKYERLGLDDSYIEILGEKIPLIRLPIYPGKNITVISEVIALNQLLKLYGHHSAKIFEEKLHQKQSAKIRNQRNYLGHDFE
jgi:HPr kinase/phosphorylase